MKHSSANTHDVLPAAAQIELLSKLKDLLDAGLLTREEFEDKKKQLFQDADNSRNGSPPAAVPESASAAKPAQIPACARQISELLLDYQHRYPTYMDDISYYDGFSDESDVADYYYLSGPSLLDALCVMGNGNVDQGLQAIVYARNNSRAKYVWMASKTYTHIHIFHDSALDGCDRAFFETCSQYKIRIVRWLTGDLGYEYVSGTCLTTEEETTKVHYHDVGEDADWKFKKADISMDASSIHRSALPFPGAVKRRYQDSYVSRGTYCCDRSDASRHYVLIGNSLRDALSLSQYSDFEGALRDYKGTDRYYSHIQISSTDALDGCGKELLQACRKKKIRIIRFVTADVFYDYVSCQYFALRFHTFEKKDKEYNEDGYWEFVPVAKPDLP